MGRPKNTEQVILSKVEEGVVCWKWLGTIGSKGYGRTRWNGKYMHSHRAVYEILRGEVSPELQLDHLCRNRACVNPDHLEPVTAKVNVLRGEGLAAVNAKKTHCPKNHEYSNENTYILRNHRYCKECSRVKLRLRRAKVKELSYVHA